MNVRQKYVRGIKDDEVSQSICEDCGLEDYQSKYKILHLMYHVDTYKNLEFWRVQGYVYIKDIVNLDIYTPVGSISAIDDEYILFFTERFPLKLYKDE